MTIEEAIKTAVEYEVRIRDVYREAAAAVDDEIGKRIFETLGKDEQNHIDYLEYKLKQLQSSGAIVPSTGKLRKSNRWYQKIFLASDVKCWAKR